MNQRLVLCMTLSVLTAAISAGLCLVAGGGWLLALAAYMTVGSTSLVTLAVAAAWIGDRAPLARTPRPVQAPLRARTG